jgi:hypothetical protein
MQHGTVSSRRRFGRTAGAALSATAAAAVAAAPAGAGDGQTIEARLARLEDAEAIRRLHLAWLAHVNEGAWESARELFAADAEVQFAGGVFAGRERGIRRLLVEHFGRSLGVARPGPVPTFLQSRDPHLDAIDVAPDRHTATARLRCTARVASAIGPDCTLAEMAILQGVGTLRWQETADVVAAYLREGAAWRIARLVYRAPAGTASYTATYPTHSAGPDRLL